MKYRYDSEAREEYRNAIHFYGKAAERFFDAVESTIERIRNAPTQFREIEPGVRVCRVPNFPYAIYYIIESSEIIIVAVKHDRRDPGTGVIEFHNVQKIAFAWRRLKTSPSREQSVRALASEGAGWERVEWGDWPPNLFGQQILNGHQGTSELLHEIILEGGAMGHVECKSEACKQTIYSVADIVSPQRVHSAKDGTSCFVRLQI